MRQILKRVFSLSLVLLCVFTVGFGTGLFDLEASAATTYYEAIESEVVLRAGPSSDYDVMKTITKGTVVKAVGSTTNSSGNVWYKLSNGYYVFSDRVKKHTHVYFGGICTNTTCKYEYPLTVTSVSRTGVVTNTAGAKIWSRPYSNNSTHVRTEKYGAVLSVVGFTTNVNEKGEKDNLWFKLSDGRWVYSGNVTERFTVKYNMNGGTGSIPSQTFLSGNTLKLSTVKPTKVGYNFKGWATSSTATSATYASGGSYSAKKSVTLYAVWAKCTHSYESGYCTKCKYEYPLTITSVSKTVVVTNADGCTYYNRPYSGSSVSYGVYAKGKVLTVKASTKNQPGNLWYKTSDNYWIYSGNVTERFTIKYNANGGTNPPATHYALYGTKVTFSKAAPKRVGYEFKGWAETPTEYSSNLAYILGTNSIKKNYTLYAVWKKCTSHSYTGGICDKCHYEYPLTIESVNLRYYVVTNAEGCSYYNRAYSKNSTKYGVFAKNTVLKVIATTVNEEGNRWYKNTDGYWFYGGNVTRRYTVTYDSRGGTPTPATQHFLAGKTLTLSTVKPTKVGYLFDGWTNSPNGTVACYDPGEKYSNRSNLTLFAVWDKCTDHDYSGGICKLCKYEYPLTITDYDCTFVVTNKEGAKIWNRPYSNNSTHVTTYAYGDVMTAVKKTKNQAGNIWYQLNNGNWVYSGNVERGYWTIYNINCTNGTNNSVAVAKTLGTTFKLSTKIPKRPGYTFTGWSTTSTGAVKYKAGASYTVNGTATLYAVWAKNATITKNPATAYIKAGGQAKFTVSATGTGLTYQWQRKVPNGSWTNISGCTGTGIYVTGGTGYHGYWYRCVVKDKFGNQAVSSAAVLNVLGITAQPKTVYAANGEKLSTSVTAVGSGLTYKWYVADPTDTSYTLSSITTNTYTTTMNAERAGRRAYCVVTDKAGNSVTSNTVYLRPKASVLSQSKTTYTQSGKVAKATVTAMGDGLTYTWYIKNAGQTSYSKSSVTGATYSTKMSSTSKDRLVYCVVTDKYGYTARTETVRLRMAATITTQPKSTYTANGKTASVSLKAVGDELTYTWYVTDIGDTEWFVSKHTTNTYKMTMSESNAGRKAYCVVKDKYGKSMKSDVVTLYME